LHARREEATPRIHLNRAYDLRMIGHDTPLRNLHEAYAAESDAAVEWLMYGVRDDGGGPPSEIVASFGAPEAEYASIRRAAGIMDRPERAVVRISGGERTDFLNRLLTQELKDLKAGVAREAFLIERTGRIIADLFLVETGDSIVIDVDRAQASEAISSLESFLFSEDVTIEDVSERVHRISIHGPRSLELLAVATSSDDPYLLAPLACRVDSLGGAEVSIARRDQTGDIGVELFVPRDAVERVWSVLLHTDNVLGEGKRRVRPIGWHAYNVARIEGGTPLMNIDFGTTNLPHETGVLHQRVSFRKGCYPGQEIVARMESRGKSKQTLVGLRVSDDVLPVAGTQAFGPEEPSGNPVGIVTSSADSPMLGAQPVAFAMIRTHHAEVGSDLILNADGRHVGAVVTELPFWKRDQA